MESNYNQHAFINLVKSGLWEKDVILPNYKINFKDILRLAEEQSVVGLVVAGLEHVTNIKVPQNE